MDVEGFLSNGVDHDVLVIAIAERTRLTGRVRPGPC